MGNAYDKLKTTSNLSAYIDGNTLYELTRRMPDRPLNGKQAMDAGVFWNIINVDGWKIEEHFSKGIYRILDRDKYCRAYGNESDIIQPVLDEVERKTAEERSKPSNAGIDVPEELRKYKELADDGVITQEEFAIKKKELLGF